MTLYLAAVCSLASVATAVTLNVASSGGNASSPLQYGLMFEDINHSGDGGVYAELIQNRAFQGSDVYPSTLDPWTAVGDAVLTLTNDTNPLSWALPTSINVKSTSKSTVGISNPGWWGIDVQPQKYTGSFYAIGDYQGKFTASLQSALTNETWASVDIQAHSSKKNWTEYKFELVPGSAAPNINNTFVLEFEATKNSSLNFNLISLFPPTYKDRPNGMRRDICEALEALSPSFFRIPGGNNLEGNDPPYYWKWNETIGPLTERPGRPGTWGYENTDGMGLAEYLDWAADLGATPVWAIWAGYYLDYTTISNDTLQIYVQDALDQLEYILGDTSTPYGALRASQGHPDPWDVHYIEIGNEDNVGEGLSSYESYRLADFYNAISAKYPDLVLMSSTSEFVYKNSAEDYHQYTRPDYFVSQFGYFDHFPIDHPTLIGEFATVQPNDANLTGVDWSAAKTPYPFWVGSVAEAIFLIGAERNTDKIIGASYAPLLQNLNSYEWSPDLISFTADPSQDVLSTSYQVIELLSNNRFTEVLPVTTDNSTNFGPAYWVAGSVDDQFILKAAVYNTTEDIPFSVTFEGLSSGSAELTVLTTEDPYAMVVVDGPNVVNTAKSTLSATYNGTFTFSLPQWSVALLKTQ